MRIRSIRRRVAVSLMTLAFLAGVAGSAAIAADLKVGDKAPDFSAMGLDGKQVKFSSFRGKQVVLTFNRANW